jgi:hypothetical protein
MIVCVPRLRLRNPYKARCKVTVWRARRAFRHCRLPNRAQERCASCKAMAAIDSSMTTVTPSGVHFGDDETEDDYVRMHGTVAGEGEYAIVLGGGADGAAAVRVRNVQDAHFLTDAATWGQVVAATDNALEGAARQATYKAPCATSSQGVLNVVPGDGDLTLTVARDTEGFDGDTWYFGGRPLTAMDASEGARVLIRHGVSILGAPTDHAYNGIYYFAAGHGLESEDGPLTITRATDMNTNVSVRGATTYVSGGTDAGKVFVVTEPEDYEDFELGMGDIDWTVHAGQVQLAVNAVAEKRPCLTSTGAAIDVVAMTASTLTINGPMFISEDGSWVLGGRTITVQDANNGARILVRHSVILDMSTTGTGNGIYYFADGHGLAPGAATFTLTRAADMASSGAVDGACVRVLFGDDAGRSFMVTRPEHNADFELGTDEIEWSAAADGGTPVDEDALVETAATEAVNRTIAKRPCLASTQAALAVISATVSTLTVASDGSGEWTLGTHTFTAEDADRGARVLVRHGALVGDDAESANTSYNGIYYFAIGHGFGPDLLSFTLTRAPDMGTDLLVSGACVRVFHGQDAGREFMVTTPQYGAEFQLGTNAIVWTAASDVDQYALLATAADAAINHAVAKRPCLTSTQVPLGVLGATATTLTLSGILTGVLEFGTWSLGGRIISADDAGRGARILVRHGVVVEEDVDHSSNGIYYFAPGHGFAIDAESFTLTRAADMASNGDVSGASTTVLFGTDAGCTFTVTVPEQGELFSLGDDVIQWTGARGNDASVAVVAGAGVAVAGGSTVSLDVESLDDMAVEALDVNALLPIAASAGGTFKCTLQTLAELEQDLSNKTLINSGFSGNVGFDEAAVLQVNSNDLLTLRAGSLTVTGTLSASMIMAQTVAGPSDINLKDAVEKCPGLDAVRRLEGSKWQWKSDGSPGMGLIAQWLMRVEPSLVVEGPEGLGILYNGLVGVLVNAVNDLDAQLQAVVARVQALEQRPSFDLTL